MRQCSSLSLPFHPKHFPYVFGHVRLADSKSRRGKWMDVIVIASCGEIYMEQLAPIERCDCRATDCLRITRWKEALRIVRESRWYSLRACHLSISCWGKQVLSKLSVSCRVHSDGIYLVAALGRRTKPVVHGPFHMS